LKWTPDYDDAASEYEKAGKTNSIDELSESFYPISSLATLYKNARQIPKCVEYHLKAAECFEQNRSFFSAAK